MCFTISESMVAVVIAFISLLVSIWSAKRSYEQNEQINSVNMQAKYYDKIFDDYLINKIPQARKYLRFKDDVLVDSEKFSQVLSELLNDSLYFKYDNKEFYMELKKIIQKLDDYVVNCGNKRYEQEEQGDVFKEIHDMLSELYKCINKNYIGKR